MVIACYLEPDTLNPHATHVLAATEKDVVEGCAATNDQMQSVPREVATPSPSQPYASDSMPPNGLSEGVYSSAPFTDVIKQAEQMIDQAAPKTLFGQAPQILGRGLPMIPICSMDGADAPTSRLHGLIDNTTNDGNGRNMEEWVLEP